MLGELGIEVVMPEDLGITVDVEETGTTFAENAALKARAIRDASGLPAIGDDSGLCVDWLGGAPGCIPPGTAGWTMTRPGIRCCCRTCGARPTAARTSTSSIVCAFPNGDELTAEGECPGTIAFAPMGERGFGYDPVFFVPSLRKTFCPADGGGENAISHRGIALRAFAEELKDYLEKNEYGTDK